MSPSEKEYLPGHVFSMNPTPASSVRNPSARTAAYLRVSTADQSPDLQRDGIARFAERAGLGIEAWYCDEAVSGRREARPDLGRLMGAARRRELACVVVWKFDRFARSASHLIRALDEFDHLGIRFVSVQSATSTRRARWGGRCSRSSGPWPSWSRR